MCPSYQQNLKSVFCIWETFSEISTFNSSFLIQWKMIIYIKIPSSFFSSPCFFIWNDILNLTLFRVVGFWGKNPPDTPCHPFRHTHTHTHMHTHPPFSPPTFRQCTWVQVLETLSHADTHTHKCMRWHIPSHVHNAQGQMHTHTDKNNYSCPVSSSQPDCVLNSVFGQNLAANSRLQEVSH